MNKYSNFQAYSHSKTELPKNCITLHSSACYTTLQLLLLLEIIPSEMEFWILAGDNPKGYHSDSQLSVTKT